MGKMLESTMKTNYITFVPASVGQRNIIRKVNLILFILMRSLEYISQKFFV